MSDNHRLANSHNNLFIVDAHFDLGCDVLRKRKQGRKQVIKEDYLEDFKKAGVNVIVSSIFVKNDYLPEMGLRVALDQISALYYDIEETADEVSLCKSYDDLLKTIDDGRIAVLLSLEGVEPIGNDLSLLRIFYELGVRGVGLCWSRRNYAADGCHYASVDQGKNGGLTDFGVKVIKEAEKLGMFIDVSHINDEGFWDVIKYTNSEIIASHSNSRKLAGTMRNLTDDQIKAIAAKNGVIGINAASIIVSDDDDRANVSSYVDHIDYIVNLVGINHVGLGFDFCDQERINLEDKGMVINGVYRRLFDVIKGHKNIYKLTEELLKRGYVATDIEKIYSQNFMRVFLNTLK